jgi:nucleoside-diphosphate-sugar epimerase
VRTLVHLAAILPGEAGPGRQHRELWETNVEGTREIARTARTAGVARVVHVSSAGVYGDGDGQAPHRESGSCHPSDEYELSKLEAEKALAEELRGSKVGWTVLRPGGIYGPGRASSVEFYRRVSRRRIWLHGPARIILHPTHVGDLVQAILLALDAPGLDGETINVGGDRPIEYRELVRMVARRLGVHVTQIALPYPVAWTVATTAESFLGVFGASARARLRRMRRRLVSRALDTSIARDRLGFVPMSLERGLDETIDWARQEGLLARARS